MLGNEVKIHSITCDVGGIVRLGCDNVTTSNVADSKFVLPHMLHLGKVLIVADLGSAFMSAIRNCGMPTELEIQELIVDNVQVHFEKPIGSKSNVQMLLDTLNGTRGGNPAGPIKKQNTVTPAKWKRQNTWLEPGGMKVRLRKVRVANIQAKAYVSLSVISAAHGLDVTTADIDTPDFSKQFGERGASMMVKLVTESILQSVLENINNSRQVMEAFASQSKILNDKVQGYATRCQEGLGQVNDSVDALKETSKKVMEVVDMGRKTAEVAKPLLKMFVGGPDEPPVDSTTNPIEEESSEHDALLEGEENDAEPTQTLLEAAAADVLASAAEEAKGQKDAEEEPAKPSGYQMTFWGKKVVLTVQNEAQPTNAVPEDEKPEVAKPEAAVDSRPSSSKGWGNWRIFGGGNPKPTEPAAGVQPELAPETSQSAEEVSAAAPPDQTSAPSQSTPPAPTGGWRIFSWRGRQPATVDKTVIVPVPQAVGPGLSTVVKPPSGALETTVTPLETNEAFEEDQLQIGATQNFS